MLGADVSAQVFSGVVGFVARHTSGCIQFFARKGLDTLVECQNVPVQSILLAECLVTASIATTSKLFFCLVGSDVSSQSRSCSEACTASFPLALVVAYRSMLVLDMMLQVAVSEEGFGTGRVRAFEVALIVVGAKMIFQSRFAVKDSVAVDKCAFVDFLAAPRKLVRGIEKGRGGSGRGGTVAGRLLQFIIVKVGIEHVVICVQLVVGLGDPHLGDICAPAPSFGYRQNGRNKVVVMKVWKYVGR